MESKGLCLDTAQAWGSLTEGVGRSSPPNHAQEKFSTIKEPLINLTYVPKLHIRRMIPISLKPNSVQAQLHISSAILLFVFTGRSLTTCLFHITSAEIILTEWCWYWWQGMLLLLVNIWIEGNARRRAWMVSSGGAKMSTHDRPATFTDSLVVISHNMINMKWSNYDMLLWPRGFTKIWQSKSQYSNYIWKW